MGGPVRFIDRDSYGGEAGQGEDFHMHSEWTPWREFVLGVLAYLVGCLTKASDTDFR